jgi:hypothetical protein
MFHYAAKLLFSEEATHSSWPVEEARSGEEEKEE